MVIHSRLYTYFDMKQPHDKKSLQDRTNFLNKEWDSRNEKAFNEYTKGSKFKALWKCSICSFEWKATICNRIGRESGCPNCWKLNKIGSKNRAWCGCGDISGRDWWHVKANIAKRGFTLKLTVQEAWDIFLQQNRTCPITGRRLDVHGAWLDRIDDSQDFVRNNLQWVDKRTIKRKTTWSGFGEISGSEWARIKASAIHRNIEFAVTLEYVWSLYLQQEKRCPLTGRELHICKRKNGKRLGNASLDRIDSSLGYTEGNLQWIDKSLQTTKGKLSNSAFIAVCKEVALYHTSAAKPPSFHEWATKST